MRAQLAGETDLAGFRAQARKLLALGVKPDDVEWTTQAGNDDLFSDALHAPQALHGSQALHAPAADEASPSVHVPAAFVVLCETVALHRDPQRFALLYRLLWRLQHEPQLRHDPLDTDMLLAHQMAHAVGHDMHKMRAFVRFREVPDTQGTVHVAWFEPAHYIVEANAPWFARRFAQMRWAILTPDRCVSWDGKSLLYRPGAERKDAPPADAGEQLWLTYYRSIFNPARLKLATMAREMPRRYWHNLPEASLISPLAAQAVARSGAMVAQPPTLPSPRAPLGPVRAEVATRIETLAQLHQAVQQCRACPIGAGATHGVCGVGPSGAELMLVGEQPGDREDLAGTPFVGPAGQLLDRAMSQAGIAREAVFLTNAVRHFKYELRGKRRIHKTPAQAEAAACAHWLEQEITLARPQRLVALGATAARTLLQRPVGVNAERGRWQQRSDGLRVLVTWHPSALLRMEEEERAAAFEVFVRDLATAAAG